MTTSTRINILRCTYVHLRLFHLKLHSTLRVFNKGLLTQNATWCQNRGCICISSIKENIWSNPHASSIHPVIQRSTIILWTELFSKKRREKIQGENFNLSSSTVVFPHFYKNYKILFEYSVFYSVSTQSPTVNSIYRINSTRNTTTTRLTPCRLLPATVPRVSKHSTRQNKAPGYPTVFQAYTALAGFQLILPGRIAS